MLTTKFRIVVGMDDEVVGDRIERAHRWMQVMVVISFLAWIVGSSVIRSLKSINNLYK